VLLATRCALAAEAVSALAIEASEFPAEADRHGVHGVPAIVVADRPAWTGSVPERVFVERLVAAASPP
jgi:predicted DsbA family dithiol-disulfide isomerase